MSAIWGCIDLSGAEISSSISQKMSECLKKYKVDAIREIIEDNVYMACGLQYITRESKKEKLPFREENYYFTADCIIDNRNELIGAVGCERTAPDGSILFEAWKKWGELFGKYVIGMFAFAVFDKSNGKLYLYTDHTASRCIHYAVYNDRVYFATLTDSITNAIGDAGLCEKWLRASIATDYSFSFLFEGLTPFEGIYIVPYGSGVEIDTTGSTLLRRYWNPLKTIRQRKKFDDIKCRSEFRKTFFDCVRDAIRTDGEVGVLLSSGLDSTSVAGVASGLLDKKGKKLYSFTSVPLREFKETLKDKNSYFVDDESDKVLEFCGKYRNIEPAFIECRGKSIWTNIEKWVDYLEIPGKGNVNQVWLHEAYKNAKNSGSKIVLNGFYGNFTISYGNIMESFKKELMKGHLVRFWKQFLMYADKARVWKKRYLKYFFKILFERQKIGDDIVDKECVKNEILESYGIKYKWIRKLESYGGYIKNASEYRSELVSSDILQLNGVYCTKNGLYHGLLIRDPTMDKRMLELCMSLPYQCFAWNGIERRLVREYLKDIVPDNIRLITRHRGRQSGDAAMRLDMFGFEDGRKPWDVLSNDIGMYCDISKVKALLMEKTTDYNIDRKAKYISFSLFLNKYRNKKCGR